jgi:hypothetical protein
MIIFKDNNLILFYSSRRAVRIGGFIPRPGTMRKLEGVSHEAKPL